jgi:CheY-like chemotaxis protein
MPGLGGLQVVQHIRRVNPEIRILLSSGYSDALGEDRTLQLIEKPYTPQILLQKVAELLEEE